MRLDWGWVMLFKRFISDLLTVTFCSGIYSSNIFAFVLISPEKPILPVSPEQPEITFNWDGRSPTLKNKGNYRGGIYQDLSDTELFEPVSYTHLTLPTNREV